MEEAIEYTVGTDQKKKNTFLFIFKMSYQIPVS